MAAPGPPAARMGRPRKASTAASHAGPSNAPADATPSASTPAPGTTGGGPSLAPGTMHSFAPSTGPQTVAECENFAAQLLDPNTSKSRVAWQPKDELTSSTQAKARAGCRAEGFGGEQQGIWVLCKVPRASHARCPEAAGGRKDAHTRQGKRRPGSSSAIAVDRLR